MTKKIDTMIELVCFYHNLLVFSHLHIRIIFWLLSIGLTVGDWIFPIVGVVLGSRYHHYVCIMFLFNRFRQTPLQHRRIKLQ